MQKEFGGYLPLELRQGEELFDKYDGADVLRFDCGRNAIAAALLSIKPDKVYIPYYNCNVVVDTLDKYAIPYERYFISEDFLPTVPELEENEWLLCVNYFGNMPKQTVEAIAHRYKRVIFDNTQAFFTEPVLTEDCFNAYSPRKFVGIPDGAYLVWKKGRRIECDYPVDVSWDRASFLFKAAELGTGAAYKDNLDSKAHMGGEIRQMSVLTRRMLGSVDYDYIRNIRKENARVLNEALGGINELSIDTDNDLFCYPLLVECERLRGELVANKVYVPQWWKYLLEIVPEHSFEHRLSRLLLPLPIDQRYTSEDMQQLAGIVLDIMNK